MQIFFSRLPRKESYFFVDVGANDGISFSNTLALEQSQIQHWQGILIEADSQMFAKCVKNRPHTPAYNVALCNKDEMVHFMAIEGYAQMLSGIVEDYHPAHLERIEREIAQYGGSYKIFEMQGARFCSIMSHSQHKHIDYLSIDVEGSEMQILQGIDFERYDITLIGIEDNYPTRSKIQSFLKQKGYVKVAKLGADVFFAKTQNL
ncbi:FkbM family methyltransferase [Helicobacter jaachi]|uniref:FkbM family methyltransferase n=1 Tax=Helicobacter jaachi TaxID=1677920 RepID=UPI0018836275|nr:FkbM family methyltransferase [Helicobacter jaachi]